MKTAAPKRFFLNEHMPDILRCVKCGSCRAVCPSFLDSREESLSARGRIALIKAVHEGRLAVSEILEDRLEKCMSCYACEGACASKVPVLDIIQAARELCLSEAGPAFLETVISRVLRSERGMSLAAWSLPLMLHYSAAPMKKQGTAGTLSGPKFKVNSSRASDARNAANIGRVLFFPGCAVNYLQPDIGNAAVSVLRKLGYDVIVPAGLKCCGRPLLSLGDRPAATELAARNLRVLAATRVDAIVTPCASCGLTFKKEYPKLLASCEPMPVMLDIHEFLAEAPQCVRRPINRTITWHDPCHLNRGQGLGETARKVLRTLPGIHIVEMKNADRCCGFGGVMRVSHRGLSDRIAGAKAESIIDSQADTVVTGCPSCRMQISNGLRNAGSNIEVLHTVQLLNEAFESD